MNERTRRLLTVARTAWADTRDALAEGGRSPTGRFGDATTQSRLRAAMRAKPTWLDIRAAPTDGTQALAPFDFNEGEAIAGEVLDANGNPLEVAPQPSAKEARAQAKRERREARQQARDARRGWVTGEDPQTTAQVDDLWARARTLLRELNAATTSARQGARAGTTEAVRDIASFTEQGLTAITRPLSTALAASVQPLANAAGGVGIGVVLALGVVAYASSKKN